MLKKLGLFGLLVASLPIFGCGRGSKEIEATNEEAPMDQEMMNKMAEESLKHMPPEQQAKMKKQLEAQKSQ
ncbi:MAG: hypothetical protein CMJ64_21000 [Planctomycetaceae bacterium]|jgi:hypothetical protein|nr:hypothetical protein [Planctomycetaceae bacterium]